MTIVPVQNRDWLDLSSRMASAAMQAQSTRMRVVSENIANADATASTPGGNPYRRKTITFRQELDRATGVEIVGTRDIGTDKAPFGMRLDPGHPGADTEGYVKVPNVNVLVEMADLREAVRSYEANVQVVKFSRSLSSMTIDLLRNS
ncbi:flagellar basal-body rod protein FlgC [Pseudochelatococcus lubricantis]|uniref:Flagellar basal-body rod protein FlgC n=1 Tax=Pseudochelatococcus lubricantis TaxID=1538102 RepID=A0ABX0UVX6_9HYPH|nr:flagellar basal body rod protein FlgC [Pseudochelatococcus lubricantis]NIJ57106.1 flagellar basal-body rod protein FlgC [Pseudochelatococcus lubricantis]